jgi:FMN phosphatase YigB (HAD superfamily)
MIAPRQHLRRPTVLLLDIDNTVYRYEPCHKAGIFEAFQARPEGLWPDEGAFLRAYQHARATVKRRIAPGPAAHCRCLYFKEMIDAATGCTQMKALCRMHRAYWDGYASMLHPDFGCREFLENVQHLGIRLAWVSNFTTQRQIWKLEKLGLDEVGAILVTSEEVGIDKPDPAVLDLAMARLAARNRTAWVIGDEPADVVAAHSRDMAAVLMQDGGPNSCPADCRVNSWQEIGELLSHAAQ